MSNASAVLEYRTRDKSEWPRGEWQNEPDKVQWVDSTTGLDCLIVRGPSGALCGYVGVSEQHPWFGKDYGQCTLPTPCDGTHCDHAPDSNLSVHGGITFADACHEASRETWERWRTTLRARADEAVQHPKGSTARALKEGAALLDDYEAWAKHNEASAICHRPLDGRPDRVWWFGFDCAHSGDLCPSYDRGGDYHGTYKTRAYVEAQCATLASQLAATHPPLGRTTG